MARKSATQRQAERLDKDLSALDRVAKKVLSTIDTGYKERLILSDKSAKMQKIIDNELDFAKGVSKGSIIDFVAAVTKNTHNGISEKESDAEELFTQDIGNLFGYFQEMYKNKYIELADLKFITKFIPAIGEAVKVTLDSIVGADDMSTTITRILEMSSGLTEDEVREATVEIERMEKDEKLLKKLKNIVYKKTLIAGQYYVYAVPYADLFAEYQNLVNKGKINPNPLAGKQGLKSSTGKTSGFNMNKANESYFDYDVSGIFESAISDNDAIIEGFKATEIFDKDDISELSSALKKSTISSYQVSDSEFLAEALEGIASVQAMRNNLEHYVTRFGGSEVSAMDFNIIADGTADINKVSHRNAKFNTTGTYIKYIDANHIIPIKVFNQIIGYYYVHDTTVSKKDVSHQASSQTNLLSVSSNLFNSTKLSEKKREAAVRSIVDTISEGILEKFSNKFVNKHSDFKNLIADCIIANGMVNNNFQIQFIPAKYIVPFIINEDENGSGESILQDALFPAKLLLSLVVNKLLTYMNKSGNKTIAHIKKGPINVNSSNHVQRVIRMLQESQITFSDLLSTNLTFTKFARDGNIQLPSAKNGDRLVEFETQEGQQIDMRPEMEEFLEKMAIMGTGVPSVILEYTDAADYAKSIVTANIKFASRIASLQADLEEATTELYKILIMGSNMREELKLKVIRSFKFSLPRPKVLSNQNIADYLQTIQGSAQTQADIMYGQNADEQANPDLPKEKDRFIKNTIIENAPFIDWKAAQERMENARLEIIEEKRLKEPSGDNDDLANELDAASGDDF